MYSITHFPPVSNQEAAPRLSEQPTIHPSACLRDCVVGSWTDIGPNCWLAEATVGDYTYFAGDAQVIYAKVGKFCSIASHVRINPGNHPMDRVTQHHATYRRVSYGFSDTDDEAFFSWRRAHACHIGHDVWLGHGVTVMPGVSIGTGAAVGSGAVVTKPIGDYEIAVGVPARVIRKRFSDDVIAALLRIAWWDWDRSTLEARFDALRDVDTFIAAYG
jgi:hypothetical protein